MDFKKNGNEFLRDKQQGFLGQKCKLQFDNDNNKCLCFCFDEYTEKKTNNQAPSPRDKLDKIWEFDYPAYAFNWADNCSICEKGGKLILCEGPCVGSFHIKCLGLKCEPADDPWYCDKCKALKAKRTEIYEQTGGKSSRFRPGTYTVKIWMDHGNDNTEVYQETLQKKLTAKCFYPDKKSKKSKSQSKKEKSKSKRKRKRTRSQMENE